MINVYIRASMIKEKFFRKTFLILLKKMFNNPKHFTIKQKVLTHFHVYMPVLV